MKTLLAILITMGSVSAFAKSTIYCKDSEGKVLDALDPSQGWECEESLVFGGACFTGKRAEVITLLNEEGNFGSDENWIENAKYKGRDSISYEWVDGPNELRDKKSIDRCTDEFFGK